MNSGHKRERGTILFILKGKELLKRKANDEAVRSLVDLTASAPSHELSGEHQRKSPHSSQTSTPEQLITEDVTKSPCTLPQRKLDCPANKRTSPRQRQLDFSASKRRSPRITPQRQLDCTRKERSSSRTPTRRQVDCTRNERNGTRTPPPPRRQLDCTRNERSSPCTTPRRQLHCTRNKRSSSRTPPPPPPPRRQPVQASVSKSPSTPPSVTRKEKEPDISELLLQVGRYHLHYFLNLLPRIADTNHINYFK